MRITLSSGTAAELATPDGGEPTRGLALAPDIMGLRPLFDDMCARLAAEHGWAVCAPEPFPGNEGLALEDKLSMVQDDSRLLGDLIDAADRTGCERVAVLGFCMGGSVALKAAGSGRFDRAVAFYGMIRTPEPWKSPNTVEPLDAVGATTACPVLAIVGGLDIWTPPDDVALLRALPNVEVAAYPDADHGFVHDPSRPSHRADDAADAWRRAVAFLA